MDILAVAESDAFVKWAAWTLDRAPAGWSTELRVIRTAVSASARQVDDALAGTRLAGQAVEADGLLALRSLIRRRRPDVVLVACTGPTLAAVVSLALPRSPRPLVVNGLPGIGLPVRERAIRARRGVDVFIAHSRRERAVYRAAFAAAGAPTVVALGSLPFLTGRRVPPSTGEPTVVFAPQPSIPRLRAQRIALLERLAALGPPAPIVKLRGIAGEAVTHDEPHPYPVLWDELFAAERVRGDELRMAGGPFTEWLRDASCVVTVSSTAALEALDGGRPVVVIDDFGVSTHLLNDIFEGSGLLAPLNRDAVRAAGTGMASWRDANYFHAADDNDWIELVEHARHGPRPTRGVDRTHAVVVGRGVVRSTIGARHS